MVVIGATPVPGTGVNVATAPYDVRSLSAADLEFGEIPSATEALSSRLGGVNINDDLDDPFQPDLVYRGFEASPALGTPQGLAVYQNGVRINEPFGDTVNWDLVPSDAIARIDVVGTNPVYGLNALGGAVVIGMKNGFDDPGGQLEVSGGSFGRRSLALTYGAHSENLAAFVAARGLDQDGWRLLSADQVRQVYVDLSARTDRMTLDLSYTGDDNILHGEGPSPVQELAVDRRLIFTSPQASADRLNFVTLNSSYAASSVLSFQAVAYIRDYRQSVANGDSTGYVACAGQVHAAYLCQPDAATPLVSTSGSLIPDLSAGGSRPIGENDRESIHTLSFGGAAQATSIAKAFGHENHLSFGVEVDQAHIAYDADTELGVIDSALVVQPSGFVVSTQEGTDFTATPVRLHAENTDFGAFATDTLNLTRRLSLTASGRYNWVRVSLHDLQGSNLSGASTFSRLNPAIGMTYQLVPGLTAYAGYAEGSRAPTASEIECSDPKAPCLLPSSLSADPPNLRQVVSRTYEVGLRGSQPILHGQLTYSLGLYRTEVRDDIYAVATSLSTGFFKNIRGTLRQGGELDLAYRDRRLTVYASTSVVDAVFATDLTIPSPSNPLQDANGDIHVRRGDQIPGIPRFRFKLGAEYWVLRGLRVGGELQVLSSQYYRGDEANQLAPLPGYAVVGLHASYDVTPRLQLFAKVENLLNARYATFGVLGDPTGVGAPGVPANAGANEPSVDDRFQSPAAPIAAYGGFKLRF